MWAGIGIASNSGVGGAARITPGFDLAAACGETGEDGLLRCCYREPLNLARAHSLSNMAFPSISFGIYHFPPERAPLIATCEVRNHLAGKTSIEFVAFDSHMFGILSTYTKQGG